MTSWLPEGSCEFLGNSQNKVARSTSTKEISKSHKPRVKKNKMPEKKVQEPSNSILREGLRLISSGVAGQLVALLLLAIVGRQYNEETMGILGSFLSWGGLLSIVACGRYEQGIVVAPREEEARSLYHLALRIAQYFFGLLLPLSILLGIFAPNATPLGRTIYLLPLYVLLLAWYNASAQWVLRQRQYGRLAQMQLIKGVGNNLLKVLFGLLSASVGSLIAAQLLSLFAPYSLFVRSLREGLRKPSRDSVSKVARQYQGFPRYGLIQALVDNLLGSLLILMLPLHFGAREVGLLTMAIMLARRPLQLISENLGSVYFERMSKRVAEREPIRPMVRKLLVIICLLGIPLALLLSLFMTPLVVLVVGERWIWSAYIIAWMLPMCIPNFATSILNVLPDIFGRQKANMWAQIGMLTIDLVVIIVGFSLFSFEQFIPYFYILMALEQVGYLLFLLYFVWHYERTRTSD